MRTNGPGAAPHLVVRLQQCRFFVGDSSCSCAAVVGGSCRRWVPSALSRDQRHAFGCAQRRQLRHQLGRHRVVLQRKPSSAPPTRRPTPAARRRRRRRCRSRPSRAPGARAAARRGARRSRHPRPPGCSSGSRRSARRGAAPRSRWRVDALAAQVQAPTREPAEQLLRHGTHHEHMHESGAGCIRTWALLLLLSRGWEPACLGCAAGGISAVLCSASCLAALDQASLAGRVHARGCAVSWAAVSTVSCVLAVTAARSIARRPYTG